MSKLQAALAWASRGYRVFPLEVNGKEPVVSAFGSCATNDPNTIANWWRDPVTGVERDYNIGMLTSDMVVCDIDVKEGKPGLQTFYGFGGHFETLVVQTPTGGYHCYFDGNDSANTYPGPGLDIRSHNGYVVAPGSTINDRPYRVIIDKPVAWVPPQIEVQLRAPGRRLDRDGATIELDTPNALAHAQAWLETSAPIAVEGQAGDSTTYTVACKLVRDFALSEETAFELLRRVWNDRCCPPWDAEELWRKVENAYAYGTGAVGQALPEASFGGMVDIPEVATFTPPTGLTFGNALPVAAIPKRPWIAPRFLMRQAVTLLIAQGSAGKTTLALVIAAHGALGIEFGSFKFVAPFKTVMYSAEEDRQELSRRLHAICAEYNLPFEPVNERIMLIGSEDVELHLASFVNRQPLTNAAHVDWLISVLSDPDVGLGVLDPLVEVHLCDETDNTQMKYVMSVLRRVAREANVALLIPHHTPKAGKEAGNADAARGAGAIVNSARIALTLFNATDKDCEVLGIREEDRRKFARLDDAKVNLTLANRSSVWFKRVGVKLYNGDEVGVMKHHDMMHDKDGQRRFIALTLLEGLTADGKGAMSMAEAVTRIQAADPLYERKTGPSIRALVESVLIEGYETDNGTIVCDREKHGASEKAWIKLQ